MSNAFRDFTIVRRRPHIVDLITPKRAGVKGYRILASPNFDGVFTAIVTADISSGYLDPAVNPAVLNPINNNNYIRIVFDPDTFNGAAGISDDQHIWLKFQPIDFTGAAGTAGNPGLVLPDDEIKSTGRVIIRGNAPMAADVSGSLILDLPVRMRDFHIKNNEAGGGHDLLIASAIGGAERPVSPQETFNWFMGAQATILVRGSGGAVNFAADFTHYLPL